MRPLLAVLAVIAVGCADAVHLPSAPADPLAPQRDAPSPAISFLHAEPGDVIRVDWQSSGCFHQLHKTMEFERLATGAALRGALVQSNYVPGVTVTLRPSATASELAGLDRLLQHFRDPNRPGGCTTVERVTLELVRDGNVAAREVYRDNSCVWLWDEKLSGFGTFWKVARPKE